MAESRPEQPRTDPASLNKLPYTTPQLVKLGSVAQLTQGIGPGVTDAVAFSSLSDRKRKERFAPVDALAVLTRLAALPIASCAYRAERPAARHLGLAVAAGIGPGSH
jgi:hypothetical protein